MSQNQAAWMLSAGAPFTVDKATFPKPGPGQVVIKNAAVAINPVEWKIQKYGRYHNKFPFILGEDAAGTVEEVGPGVTRFRKGQRVISHCIGIMTAKPENAAFQLYTLAVESLTAELPDSISFEDGAVLPLALSTASAGLYQSDKLSLPLPSADDVRQTKQTILIWGGASSVGASAIQLAVASGVIVITTASPQNHDFVKSLGASVVVDYRSSNVVEEVVNALRGTDFVGVYEAISEDQSFEAVQKILVALKVKAKIASVMPYDKATEDFSPQYVHAFSIIEKPNQHVGERIWGKFVPEGLANGKLKPLPQSLVVGQGLEALQYAVDVQQAGVSAKKIVVAL